VDEVRMGVAAGLRLMVGVTAEDNFINATIEVFSVAIRDAEAMTSWDGETKRAFATKLILSMMEDFDWIPEDAWYSGLLEGLIGVAIDITVAQLNFGDPSWASTPRRRTLKVAETSKHAAV
jgi:hypothetical protein